METWNIFVFSQTPLDLSTHIIYSFIISSFIIHSKKKEFLIFNLKTNFHGIKNGYETTRNRITFNHRNG